MRAVEAPDEVVRSEIFNVGSDSENYRVKDLAQIVAEEIPGISVDFTKQVDDERDYRVSFEKMKTQFGFAPERTVRDSVREIRQSLMEGPAWDIQDSRFPNVKRVQE